MEDLLRPDFPHDDRPSLGLLQSLFYDVSEGRLRLVASKDELPRDLPFRSEARLVSEENLKWLRRTVSRTAASLGFDPERTQNLVLAVGEAAMNAVVHGGGGGMEVHWDEKGRLAVCIEDVGEGIPLDRLPQALFRRGYSTTGRIGQGLSIVRAYVDRLWVHTSPAGTTFLLEASSGCCREYGFAESLAGSMGIVSSPR